MHQAKCGDIVKIHFTGKTQNGDVFASSQGDEPIKFKVGGGELLPGIEKAIEGMEQGQQKIITLAPEDGFGVRQDELILLVERSQFPPDFEPQPGMELQVPQPDGSYIFFTVLEVDKDKVRLDANHPLAGKMLTFEVQLLEITT